MQNSSDFPYCCWCHQPLTVNDLLEGTICLDCYRKLVGTGLRDEEIFDRQFIESLRKGCAGKASG